MKSTQPEILDLTSLSRFFDLLKQLLSPLIGPKAWLFIGLLILMSVSVNLLNVINSYIGRDFITAIEHKDTPEFIHQALFYVLVFAASTVVAVIYRYVEERLGLSLRISLTQRLLDAYLKHPIYYRLCDGSALNGEVEYPDQRISEDAKNFTLNLLSIVLMGMNGLFTIVAFSSVLWSISPLLFSVAVVYAVVGTILAGRLGGPLIGLNYHQFDREAHFRSDLIHVRENAESIAVLRREERVKSRLSKHFEELVTNYRNIIEVNRSLGFFTTGYNYLIQIIPALIVAPLFMRGEVEFGVITQSAMAFTQLLGAFSLLVTQFQLFSSFAAIVARLGALTESMDQQDTNQKCSIVVQSDAPGIRFHHLSLPSLNNAHTLIDDLNIDIQPGTRVLVASQDEMASAALFKATAGIWNVGSGIIDRPSLDQIMFLPERPYLPHATLRELLLHTGEESKTPEGTILDLLERLHLSSILERVNGLDTEAHWWTTLSLGEQQRVAFARLWLSAPRFAVLDRPHSSLDSDTIALMLELLNLRGISYVHFGDRHEPLNFYDATLTIHEQGDWTWKKLGHEH
jgi:putative ATP-binding cassette transporter